MSIDQQLTDKICREIQKTMSCLVLTMSDPDDLAYLIILSFFKAHGRKLKGDDIVSQQGATVGYISDYSFDGETVTGTAKWLEPLHFVNITLKINDFKKTGGPNAKNKG